MEQNHKQMLTLDGDKSSLFSSLRFYRKVINVKVIFSVLSEFFQLHYNYNALLTILDQLYHHMQWQVKFWGQETLQWCFICLFYSCHVKNHSILPHEFWDLDLQFASMCISDASPKQLWKSQISAETEWLYYLTAVVLKNKRQIIDLNSWEINYNISVVNEELMALQTHHQVFFFLHLVTI